MGTHTLHFAPHNDDLDKVKANAIVAGVSKAPSASAIKANSALATKGKNGKFRQSFRPFAFAWGPNEERPVWNLLFDCINRLSVAVGRYQGDVGALFGVGVIDHKESTRSTMQDKYPGITVCQCFTHILRNARAKKGKFVGDTHQRRLQADWFANQVIMKVIHVN